MAVPGAIEMPRVPSPVMLESGHVRLVPPPVTTTTVAFAVLLRFNVTWLRSTCRAEVRIRARDRVCDRTVRRDDLEGAPIVTVGAVLSTVNVALVAGRRDFPPCPWLCWRRWRCPGCPSR